MTRAPSSGVSCCFSTAVRTSFTSLSATCHFGSIVAPNSAGFIAANWWTSECVTAPAIGNPPSGSETVRSHCRGTEARMRRLLSQSPDFDRGVFRAICALSRAAEREDVALGIAHPELAHPVLRVHGGVENLGAALGQLLVQLL